MDDKSTRVLPDFTSKVFTFRDRFPSENISTVRTHIKVFSFNIKAKFLNLSQLLDKDKKFMPDLAKSKTFFKKTCYDRVCNPCIAVDNALGFKSKGPAYESR